MLSRTDREMSPSEHYRLDANLITSCCCRTGILRIVAAETEMVILPQRLPRGARAALADTRIPGDHVLAPLGVRRLDRRAAFRPSCLDSSGDDVAVESSAVLTVGETKVGLASERITGAFCRLVA